MKTLPAAPSSTDVSIPAEPSLYHIYEHISSLREVT